MTPSVAPPAAVERTPPSPGRLRAIPPLFANAYALALSTVLTGLTGLLYWVLAARSYPTHHVGIGSALVSAMALLASVAQLSLGSALTRFLPVAGSAARRLVIGAYAATALAALVVAVAFVALVAPHLASFHGWFDGNTIATAAFCLAVVGWCLFALQDAVLTGVRRAPLVLVENVGFNVAKIGLLLVLAGVAPGAGVFASWVLPVPVAVVAVNAVVFGRLLRRADVARRPRPTVTRRRLSTFVAADYVAGLLALSATYVMPLVVLARLGAEANAYFFVAWTIGLSLDLVAFNFATSLTVEGSHAAGDDDQGRLAEMVNSLLRRTYALFVPAVVVLIVFAPIVLRLFGEDYADRATTLLRILAVSMLARPITSFALAVCRIEGRMRLVVAVEAVSWTLLLGGTWLGLGRFGLTGAGTAYLVSQVVLAVWLAPPLLRSMGRPGPVVGAMAP